MSGVNSKKKGSRNERMLAKAFEKWTGFKFARVPMSGGLRWKRTLDTTGDIMVAEQEHIFDFPFSIETKFYANIEPWKILLGQNSKLDLFMRQARDDAKRANKIPIVLFRFNQMPVSTWFIIIEFNVFKLLEDELFFENGFMNFNNEFCIFTSECLFESEYPNVLTILKDYR